MDAENQADLQRSSREQQAATTWQETALDLDLGTPPQGGSSRSRRQRTLAMATSESGGESKSPSGGEPNQPQDLAEEIW